MAELSQLHPVAQATVPVAIAITLASLFWYSYLINKEL